MQLYWSNLLQVHVSFLYVGHTHEDIDAAFHCLADTFRRNDAETLPDMMNLLRNREEIKGGIYDVRSWLSETLNEPKKHTAPHHFKFYRDAEGVVRASYKGRYDSPRKQLTYRFLKHLPNGQPKLVCLALTT